MIRYSLSKESVQQLNDFFTQQYDFNQWFYKLKTYEIILEKNSEFIETFGDSELKGSDIESYKRTLMAEIFFNFFHISEALFSIMFCAKNTKVPWLFMRSLRVKTLCDYISEEIVTGKISDEDIRFLFFNGVVGENATQKNVVESIAFIKCFLQKVGKLFLDNDAYVEYKHGLRVMTTNASFGFFSGSVPEGTPFLARSGTALVYLGTKLVEKQGKEEKHRVEQKTLGFDYGLYLRLCVYVYRLINSFFETRRQQKRLKPDEKMEVPIFIDENLSEIFKEDASKRFTFNILLP